MTVIGEKLSKALKEKEEDINNFIWKGPRKIVNGERMQTVIKLVDATPEQLKQFYNHCDSMLNNEDRYNPGRLVLLNIIKEQRNKCNAELFLRYLEDGNPERNGRPRYPRFNYLQDVRNFLDTNKEHFPRECYKTTPISAITDGIPEEFAELSIDIVLDACLDSLGEFSRKHMTLNFICKLGIWFTSKEMKDLTEKDKDGNERDKIDVVIERLGLKNVYNPKVLNDDSFKAKHKGERLTVLRINPKGLSYSEFRAMTSLRSKKYSDMTTEQLTVLRDKVLFKLEDEVKFHVNSWMTRMHQIEEVANEKGYNLDLIPNE